MNIVLASAECYPFAKIGGLADVSAYLPKEWETLGHNPIVILPKYGQIDTFKYNIQPTDLVISVPMGNWVEYGRIWSGMLPGSSVPIYLIESADYFDRKGIYGNPDGFWDNDRRFAFFSRAVMEAIKALRFKPDILLANDWHTALCMPYLKMHYRNDWYFAQTAGVINIHNAAHQGIFEPKRLLNFAQFGMHDFYKGSWFEFQGAVNLMKVGVMFADKVTTVSPRYAWEIRTTNQGYGLQSVFNARAADFIGILNGVDYAEWNPETDSRIYSFYSKDNLEEKRVNKISYLREYGVQPHELQQDMPLIGMVTRLADQKGIDLVERSLDALLYNYPIRFTLVGTGEKRYENFFRYIARKYPNRAIVHIAYNDILSHKIEAASDIFLMPSLFEPCGLNQMYSLKYGTIPVVRNTGGLADTVKEYNFQTGEGNGFTFDDYTSKDMVAALNRAISAYYNKPVWNNIMHNAMSGDFSSTRSALQYINVFGWALEKVR